MKCRPGDIAIVVNDLEHPRNNGCLLEIVSAAPPGAFSIPADWIGRPLSTFHFDDRVCKPGGRRVLGYRDSELRPLRDTDGDDETLGWADLPCSLNSAKAAEELATPVPQTTFLRATVKCAEQFVSGAWSLTVISGELGFDIKVQATAMPTEGIKPGDQIRLEYPKDGNPFVGPFIKISLINPEPSSS